MAHPNPSAPSASIPTIFTRPPPIQDALVTETLSAQQEMVWECLPYLKGTNNLSSGRVQSNEHAIPSLDRHEHIEFLHESLQEFPAAFVTVDASRPWMVYWALMGLFLLGEDVSQYRDRLVTAHSLILFLHRLIESLLISAHLILPISTFAFRQHPELALLLIARAGSSKPWYLCRIQPEASVVDMVNILILRQLMLRL